MLSKRFPQKMTTLLCGKPLLQYVIDKTKDIGIRLVVATTDLPDEEPLIDIAINSGIRVHKGIPKDEAGQFIDIAEEYQSYYIMRLNGDSPCLNIPLIEKGLGKYDGYDVVTNIPSRTYPYGITLEIVRIETLKQAYPYMDVYEKEHTFPYFYKNKEHFNILEIINKEKPTDFRFTIDYPEDLERMNKYLCPDWCTKKQ